MKIPVVLAFVACGVLAGWWFGHERAGNRNLAGGAAPAVPTRSSESALREAWDNERRILDEFQTLAAEHALTEARLATMSTLSAEAVAMFIETLLALDPETARSFVEAFSADPAVTEFEGEPHALILHSLGSAYATLGLPLQAEPLLRVATEERRARLGSSHAQTLRSLQNWAEVLLALDRREEAEGLVEELLGSTAEDDPEYAARRALLE